MVPFFFILQPFPVEMMHVSPPEPNASRQKSSIKQDILGPDGHGNLERPDLLPVCFFDLCRRKTLFFGLLM